MNRYEEIMDYISNTFVIQQGLKDTVELFIKRVYDISPEKIDMLNLTDISNPFQDEILLEWVMNGYYCTIRIREYETRLEAKLPNGERFTKYHPLVLKIVSGFMDSITKIIAG